MPAGRFAVLSLQTALPWGGSEELWAGAARHLLARGHRVSAAVHRWPVMAGPVRDLEGRGCAIHTRELRGTLAGRLLRRAGVPARDPFGWLDAARPDLAVVSTVGHPGGVAEARACRRRGVPYVLVLQAASEGHWPGDDELDAAFEAYTAAVAVCFVSDANRRLAETQFGRPLANARVVRNPFNVRPDAAPPWPDEAGGLRLASVGRFDPGHKGQDLLIDVLGRPKWRDRPVSATFVGRGPSEAGLRRLAAWRKAAVRFRPYTDDIAAVWADHHAAVLPSRAEGLPLALVEALLCGRMGVVSAVAGNPEVVEDGATGFVAAAPTADLLDDALERAWACRGEWRRMGETAARRIRDLVPPDPAAVFADFLETAAAGSAKVAG